VGLADRRRSTFRSLSGGERQRLSLALAIIGRPDVVVLDEPTSGVDPLGRDVVRTIVSDLAASGVGVILTTHDLADTERLANRIVVLQRGRVVAAGTTAELTGSTTTAVSFTSTPGLDGGALSLAAGVAVRETAAGRYLVEDAATPAVVAAVTTWLADGGHPLEDLRSGGTSLEAVYRAVTADTTSPGSSEEESGEGAR
jgi:ABC-2 type transport system ATP-binding protein